MLYVAENETEKSHTTPPHGGITRSLPPMESWKGSEGSSPPSDINSAVSLIGENTGMLLAEDTWYNI